MSALAARRLPRAMTAAGLIALAALLPAQGVQADVTGTVHELLNPEAPREAWRRRPLPDAYVVMTWTITIPTPAHPTTSCRYSEIARTDRDGRYSMEGPNFLTAAFADAHALVYSPGRDRASHPHPGSERTKEDITLARSARSPEARLGSLLVYSQPGCAGWGTAVHDPRGLMKPYLERIVAEARTLNVNTRFGKNALAGLEAAVRRLDGDVRPATAPARVVPMPVDRGALRQASPAPAK